MLYFLSVSKGNLASMFKLSLARYRSCIHHKFIYNSWNRPENVCLVWCLPNQRAAVFGDLPFSYLRLKENMAFPVLFCLFAMCHTSISLSVCPACFLSFAHFKWHSLAQSPKNEEELFVISICQG